MNDIKNKKGIPGAVGFERQGYRDIVWCPYLNEPGFILKGKSINEPSCQNCSHFEWGTHTFICHIRKPYYHMKEETETETEPEGEGE